MLSELPEGWEKRDFSSVFIIKNRKEKQIQKQDYSDVGGFPIIDQSASFIAAYSDGEPNGDYPVVIFGDHTRAVKYIDFPFFTGADGTQALYPAGGLEPKFSYYLLLNTELPNLGYSRHMRELKRAQLYVPPLDEQQRIAEILSSVDASIQATQAVIEQAERVKRGLMEDLLTGGLGSEAIARGELPEGWSLFRLADISDIRIGGTPSRSNESYWDKTGGGNIWVSIVDLKQGVVTDSKEKITSLGVEKSNVKHVPEGTVLMSFKLTIGRVALAGKDLYTNEAIAAFTLRDGVERDYLYQYLPTFVDMVETKQAVKGKTLNKKSLSEIPVMLPPLSEQQRIAEILSCCDDFIAKQKAIIEQQTRIKKGLMDDLLTGKVRTV